MVLPSVLISPGPRPCRGPEAPARLGEDDDRLEAARSVPRPSPDVGNPVLMSLRCTHLAEKVRTSTLVQSQASLAHSHEQSLPIWRSTLLPDPRGALEGEVAHLASGSQQEKGKGRQLREIWWEGVPPIWRGEIWTKLVGNGLALSERGDYARHVERFDKAVVEGRFPVKTLEELERDAERSWEGLGMFERGSAGWSRLREFLGAWVVVRSARVLDQPLFAAG
jgi:hypothetical protein